MPVTGMTIDEIEAMGGWWVSVPAAENKSINSDINGTFFDDYSKIYIVVPAEADESKIVFYVRDVADQYAMRVEGDFSKGDINLGSKVISCVKSRLPVVFMTVDKEQFNSMNQLTDRSVELSTQGTISCDERIDCNITLKPRGNATWIYPKKPYSIELEGKGNLLGMSSNKKWNMLGNYCDLSLLSNSVFYDLAERLELPYTCEWRQAVVYINGEYKGVYLFTTQNNVSKNTIALGKHDYLLLLGDPEIEHNYEQMKFFAIETDNIDVNAIDVGVVNISGTDESISKCFSIKYPKENVDIEFIRTFTQEAFDALENENSEDYTRYFDVDNLVRFYLIQEFSHNDDAVARSIYMYYDSSKEKLMLGPVWDMDSTLESIVKNPYDLVANRSWYRSLFLHDSFVDVLYDTYNNGVRDDIFDSLSYFEESGELMSVDGELDHKLVAREHSLYFPETEIYDTYVEQCEEKINEYKRRIDFLDELLMDRTLTEWIR